MGIHGLMKLLSEECPGAIKQQDFESFTGRKIAIDASMAMYQFLVAVRHASQGGGAPQGSMMLTNESGEVTSHIQGMFNRTIKMMSAGIKPLYVFDGKPPTMKSGELAKRLAKREKAESDLAAARDAGNDEDIDKFSRRLVKVTKSHNDDCKELLRLMGVPVITAPCEAEAQCSELAKKGRVYGVATEDMDALTFRTPKLIRKLTSAQGKDKDPIVEIDCELVLTGLGLTYEQFVDLCILCGCDYCSSIKSIGPKTALKLIRQYNSIENIVNILKKDKKITLSSEWFVQKIPKKSLANNEPEENDTTDVAEKEETENVQINDNVNQEEENDIENVDDAEFFKNLEVINTATGENVTKEEQEITTNEGDEEEYEIFPPIFAQARKLFLEAEVIPAEDVELKWNEPDEEGLKQFLIERMGFNADRVISGIKRLQEAQQKKAQKRLDSFFSPVATTSSSTAAVKRKLDDVKNTKNKSSKTSSNGPRRR